MVTIKAIKNKDTYILHVVMNEHKMQNITVFIFLTFFNNSYYKNIVCIIHNCLFFIVTYIKCIPSFYTLFIVLYIYAYLFISLGVGLIIIIILCS